MNNTAYTLRQKAAELLVAQADVFDWYEQLSEEESDKNHDEFLQRYSKLETDYILHMEEVAANPLTADEVVSWMVDIVGHTELTNEEIDTIADVSNRCDYIGALVDKVGVMADVAKSAIESWEFFILDAGATNNQWYFGVPCTDADARRLCSLCHREFEDDIRRGNFIIRKKFLPHRFFDIRTWDEAKQWLKENND